MIGRTLGHYAIEEKLGAGGMGEVYRARDTKLERDVALKILPAELADDETNRHRFEREAKAVAALNHRNIVHVYSVEEADGQHFITMELVQGKSLSAFIHDDGMGLETFSKHAVSIARALATAHRHGILHRDIKPSNVLINDDDDVKVLDFGLAKLILAGEMSEAATISKGEAGTRAGTIVGTLPYLSPEQAEGKNVDARSDVFSLGAMLYEMLTGRRPFRGDTPLALLAAITRDTPQPIRQTRAVPPALESVVARTLEKKPEDRYQSMDDVADAIEEAARPTGVSLRVSSRALAASMLACALIAGALWWRLSSSNVSETLPPMEVSVLTAHYGVERTPALSPSGNLVAFTWDGDSDHPALYVKPVRGGRQIALTDGSSDAYSPAWSPDETEVAFIGHDDEERDAIYTVPFTGGNPRLVGPAAGHDLAWSPDGDTLVFAERRARAGSDGLSQIAIQSGETRALTEPERENTSDTFPRFSPDGASLAFFRRSNVADGYIYRYVLDSRTVVPVTRDTQLVFGLDWTRDGKGIVFSALRGGVFSLTVIDIETGEERPIPFGEGATDVSSARDVARLAYTRDYVPLNDTAIYRAPGPAGDAATRVERFAPTTLPDSSPRFSSDGTRVVLDSWRSGFPSVWTCTADTEECQALSITSDRIRYSGRPQFSRDGRTIAFNGFAGTNMDIYTVSATGGVPTRLTTDPAVDVDPSFSFDGRWVYFASLRAGQEQAFRVPAAGGDVEQITFDGGERPRASPDDRYVVFGRRAPPSLWRRWLDSSVEEKLLEGVGSLHWDFWGEAIVYAPNGDRESLWLLDTASKETKRIVDLGQGNGVSGGLSIPADGRFIVFSRRREPRGDLALLENFR